jgi:hypothetical protein
MITLDKFRKCLAILDESQVKRLVKSLGLDIGPDDELDALTRVKLALADWFAHLGLFTDAQVYQMLGAINDQLGSFADALAEDPVPAFTVIVCDGRWVSCVGRDSFFDIKEFEELEELPDYCVTHIMCDVTQLCIRMEYRASRREGKEALDVTSD